MTLEDAAFYKTSVEACPYLGDEDMSDLVLDPQFELSSDNYQVLLMNGFRRSGHHVYRPNCPACDACRPCRIPVEQFRWTRSFRRICHRNADLTVQQETATASDEHFDLFARYIAARHADGGMYPPDRRSFESMMGPAWACPVLLTARLENRLIAAAITDALPKSLSAVYTYFEPDMPHRSLGTFLVLQQIAWASRRGARHLYLGFLIDTCKKMAYKRRFQPQETLNRFGYWQLQTS